MSHESGKKKSLFIQNFGLIVKEARIYRGWTQGELAKRTGIARISISFFEEGLRNAELYFALRLSTVLGFPFDTYFTRDLNGWRSTIRQRHNEGDEVRTDPEHRE